MTRPLIRDPQAIPIVGIDDALPPIDPARLTAAAVRERFARTLDWVPEFTGDGRLADRAPAAASVLMPLVEREQGLTVLLTQRTAHLRDHAGQVSFPGGRAEATDADAVDTALRETEEEVGLARSHIEVVGALHPYSTVTNFVVTPVVGLVRPGFELTLDAFEVAEAFEVPLAFLMTPANHRRHRFELDGISRQFLSMDWKGLGADGAQRRFFIWGATASMLRNLYRFLAA
ncbi:CoA pyrophosphatase [Aquincola sp. MAHUQ-54]|uniref:CoA pyrophosphatase n=1 Tax=Aquincola agrisoli TaxID=3119538 RepID=A0AAW9QEZ3_9BURK